MDLKDQLSYPCENLNLGRHLKLTFHQGIVIFSLFNFLNNGYAQIVPDAGALRQQIERDRIMLLPSISSPSILQEKKILKPSSGPRVLLKNIQFLGNELLTDAELMVNVNSYLNQHHTLSQLQEIAGLVAKTYRDAGWVAHAYLPAQDVTEGVIKIQLVEAIFGAVQLETPAANRISVEPLIHYFDTSQKGGQPLNAHAFERALLLADDLPGLSISGTLREGERERETDLIVTVTDKALISGDFSIDNAGARSTGKERLIFSGNFSNFITLADWGGINLMHTQGSDYVRLARTIPVGFDGLRIGGSASSMKYKLITQDFSLLGAQGISDAIGVEANYPLIRTRRRNLNVNINVDHKSFDNQSNGAITTRYRSETLTVGLSGQSFGSNEKNRFTFGNFSWVTGLLDLNGSPNQPADAITVQANGHFNKVRYTFGHQEEITNGWSIYSVLSGQWANKNLDSSEKFYLGGSTGVRAYPTSEGAGTLGTMMNLEVRKRVAENVTLTAFYDWGRIVINRYNEFENAPTLNGYVLRGKGLTWSQQYRDGKSVKATWARRIGSNPNPTTNGHDQDGSLIENSFWLSASIAY